MKLNYTASLNDVADIPRSNRCTYAGKYTQVLQNKFKSENPERYRTILILKTDSRGHKGEHLYRRRQ
jgi:hypothetical protein